MVPQENNLCLIGTWKNINLQNKAQIINHKPGRPMGCWHSAHPNRSFVSIEMREMACSFSPDAQAIYTATAPNSPQDLFSLKN